MDGAEPVSSSGVSALSERLVGVVAPKLATAAAYKDRLSPSESQAQRPNGSSSSAVTVGADAHPMLPSAAVTVLPAKTQATCQELTKAMNADESMEEKLQAGSRRRTPTSLSASGGNLSPTVLSNALVGGSAGSRPISLTHVATRDDVRGGGDGSSAMSNSTDNCSVLRAVVELLPAGGCRLINRHPASARAESISISVGSSSFGSLDQGLCLDRCMCGRADTQHRVRMYCCAGAAFSCPYPYLAAPQCMFFPASYPHLQAHAGMPRRKCMLFWVIGQKVDLSVHNCHRVLKRFLRILYRRCPIRR
uniref:Uncharacterized protein n=2 Tax=Schistocephalus solidus TaxID=70667 RepID=A0A0X3PS37_SCHSO